jgi:diacylglycerol kinase (ATP)
MRIAIILNGISRNKKKFYADFYPLLTKKFEVEVFETQSENHAIELAANATKNEFDVILSAGGDGTLHQVINGILNSQNNTRLPTVGIIPLGTGNDFARTCGIKSDVNQLIQLLEKNKAEPIDIGLVNCVDEKGKAAARYFINACSLGMGPEVVKRLKKSDRSLGPSLTYLKAITSTFFTHQPQEISAKSNSWEWKGKARVLAVANGKSFGNALYIAPDANTNDGQFNIFVAGDLPLWKFLLYLQTIKSGKKLTDPKITYGKVTALELTALESCAIEAEGEAIGFLPAKITLQPSRISFLK